MAKGKHLVPFRTQKLSPSAPMVLPRRRGGRVGRCRDFSPKKPPSGGFLRRGGPVRRPYVEDHVEAPAPPPKRPEIPEKTYRYGIGPLRSSLLRGRAPA